MDINNTVVQTTSSQAGGYQSHKQTSIPIIFYHSIKAHHQHKPGGAIITQQSEKQKQQKAKARVVI